MKRRLLCAAAAGMLALTGCSGDAGNDPASDATPTSTFDRIQSTILTPTCASSGCHTASGSAGNLPLDRSHAYASLVGVRTDNNAARTDGYMRVQAGDASKSFLYWKLLFAPAPTGREYGSPMPFGTQPLTNGQIEYIRRWIAAGAPREGEVVDTLVLSDRTHPETAAFTPLTPPASGFQMHIQPFQVQPDFERELFLYARVGNTSDIFVNRIETKMRLGSHHFLLYTMKEGTPSVAIPQANTIRDIRNSDGTMNLVAMLPMAYHVFFAGSMTPTSDYRFPDGVALRVPANTSLDLNAHYVNKTSASMTGEAYANLHTVPQSQVVHEARTLNMSNSDIVLPPHQRTTITKSFTVSSVTTIFLLTSHMHARGEKFVIMIKGGARDGEVAYENTDWEHPLMKAISPALVLQPGEGLTSVITYNNESSQTVRFGLTSEDEMGIIFGYYY